MTNLGRLLTGEPILVTGGIYFYQPTLREIVNIGEGEYWTAINLWALRRNEIVSTETEATQSKDDYELWIANIFSSPQLQIILIKSCAMLLRTKIEFFNMSSTIYIGEAASGVILDATFYLLMRELCQKLIPDSSASDEGKQYKETQNMSERERRLIEKMKASEQRVENIKNQNQGNPEDYLGRKILGLVAVGNYTFEQVYNMTMLQFNLLLQKYVEIQSFELRTQLSPYISSEESQSENKFWLD